MVVAAKSNQNTYLYDNSKRPQLVAPNEVFVAFFQRFASDGIIDDSRDANMIKLMVQFGILAETERGFKLTELGVKCKTAISNNMVWNLDAGSEDYNETVTFWMRFGPTNHPNANHEWLLNMPALPELAENLSYITLAKLRGDNNDGGPEEND